MKRIFGLAIAGLMLASCSNDDDNNKVNMKQLERKWYHVSTTVLGVTEPYDDHEPCGRDYIEFKSGTITSVDVYDCDGATPLTESFTSTYTVSGNTIIVSGDDPAEVTKLNKDTLELTIMSDDDGDGADDKLVLLFTSK